MIDESAKQAAQEYLAAKLRSPMVWKYFRDTIFEKCREWNAITGEETLVCKETALGDLRIWCAARKQQMMVYYDSQRLRITVKNGARLEHEKDVILHMEGYRTGPERTNRDVHLVRNEQAVNIDMLLVGELRVLTGIGRQRK